MMMTTMRRLDHHFGVLVVALLQSDFGLILARGWEQCWLQQVLSETLFFEKNEI